MQLRKMAFTLCCILAGSAPFIPCANAAITEKDTLVVARLAGLLQGSNQGVVTVAVVGEDAESRADAASFVTQIGEGKTIGNLTLKAQELSAAELEKTDAHIILLPASLDDANLQKIFAVATKRQLATVSLSDTCLTTKLCAIAIKTEPAVDIKMSASAAAATGVQFGSTFRMIIKELP